MKLAILIITIEKRKGMLGRLLTKLYKQCGNPEKIRQYHTYKSNGIEVFLCECERGYIYICSDNEQNSKGFKRNILEQLNECDYRISLDDDDDIPSDLIEILQTGIEAKPDCMALMGEITVDAGPPEIFEHNLKYTEWNTNEGVKYPAVKYERNITKENCIKTSIAKNFWYPESGKEANHGEDKIWSDRINASGLLKQQYDSGRILYYYNYISKK